jgi:hypothetical protein
MANEYATAEELKQSARIEDTVDDDMIAVALSAASRMIDNYCHRRFWLDPAATIRYFDGAHCRSIWVDDIGSSTDLAVAVDPSDSGAYSEAWTVATHYRLLPRNAAADGRPWTQIETVTGGGKSFPDYAGSVRVTARFGWPAVPDEVKQATLIQAGRLWRRKDSPYGVAGVAELGSEMRLLAKLDPDVQVLVNPYWLPVLA